MKRTSILQILSAENRKRYALATAFLLLACTSVFQANAQCLSASNGQWPSGTFTPTCDGTTDIIVTNAYAGEYSLVNVTAGNSYVFSTSVPTDYTTISDQNGTTAYAFGTGLVSFAATATQVVRFYTHTDAACGESNVQRFRNIACTAPTPPALYINGATFTNNGFLTVKGDMIINAGSNFTSRNSFEITGDFTNDQTSPLVIEPLLGTGSTFVFNGTSPQTLKGTATCVIFDVNINNPAGLTLTTSLKATNSCYLQDGIVTALQPTAPLILGDNAFVITPNGIAEDNNHVNGYVTKEGGVFGTPTEFPVGNATKARPIVVTFTANASGFTARYMDGDAGPAPFTANGSEATPLYAYNHAEYWDLTPTSTATGTVKVYYDNINNTGIASTADLRVAHKINGEWRNEGASAVTGTPANGTVTSNPISTWSPFTLGSISANSPLPIRLLSFSGNAEANRNRLAFATATEDPNTTFTLERSSPGGSFTAIATLPGKGGSASYQVYDEKPLSPAGYYRLKIQGLGTATYSSTVIINREAGNANGNGAVVLSPVPAADVLNISATAAALIGTPARILDAQGRETARFTLQAAQQIDVRQWAAGLYLLHLADGSSLRISKL